MIEQYIGMLGPSARLISEVLIHSLWQGSLIAALLGLSVIVFRHRSAQLRYTLSCIAMVMILVSGVVTGVYVGATTDRAPGSSAVTTMNLLPAESDARAENGTAASGTTPAAGNWLESVPLSSWVFALWVLGVLALSVYHLYGWRKTRLLVTAGADEVSAVWRQRFSKLCRTLGVHPAVQLVSSTIVRMPCVIGWMKPVVLVPLSSFTGLATHELELILLHELAHVRRLDVLVGYVQTLVETLFFFHPAVWWVSHRIRIEREHCCDDLAVACSGDKLTYARALTRLEEGRAVHAGFAAAADGAPLLRRIRRLVGRPAGRDARAGIGITGIFVVMALAAFGLSLSGISVAADPANTQTLEKVQAFRPEADDIEGDWELELDGKFAQLTMRFGRKGRTSFSIKPSDLSQLVSVTDQSSMEDVISESTRSFMMKRDAGTFFFEGEFERDGDIFWGEGECYFRASDEYIEHMEKLGFRLGSKRKTLTLALHNVSLKFVDGLVAAGYDDLSLDELLEAHIHNVSPEFIGELDKLGYRDLGLEELVKMRIHDADPEFISELTRLGYKGLSTSKLVEMKIHDVDPEFIEELTERGYDGLSTSKLVEFRIHDVTPSFVEKLAKLGYRDLSPAKLVEFKIHDVTPRFIRKLNELGYDDISPSQLVSMRIHDVSPAYISRLRDRGERNLTLEEIIDYKIYRR